MGGVGQLEGRIFRVTPSIVKMDTMDQVVNMDQENKSTLRTRGASDGWMDNLAKTTHFFWTIMTL